MRLTLLFALVIWLDLSAFSQDNPASWKSVKESRMGTVSIFWFANDPFSYKDASARMSGIEVEIMEGFQKYLKEHYDIDLAYHWKEEERFNDVLTRMKKERNGVFGLSGFSFTNERRSFMKFSPSYMADIAVLVSTPDIPIVKSKEDLKKYLEGTTALTAQGTVLEKELIQLREGDKIPFNIEYTGASEELINVLNARRKSFGYISLPVYLMNLNKGAAKVNRQNYLTKRYEGRGIGLPKTSDWDLPLNEYFASAEFKQDIESIIAKYVNLDLYHFIETFNPENEVSLLNKEKDIQQIKLKVQDLTIRDTNQRLIYLLIIIAVVSVLFFVIIILFRRLRQNLNQLKEQKMEIEAQSDQIQSINDNLETLIKKRTGELENKNKALEEYAFITAHKLRSPLATILGLVSLIEMMKLSKEDKIVISHLNESAKKLDKIVHSVMDAIDNSDVENQSKQS
jgi:hypothetical protein